MVSALTLKDHVSLTVPPPVSTLELTVTVLPAASAMNDFHLLSFHSTFNPFSVTDLSPHVNVVLALRAPCIA